MKYSVLFVDVVGLATKTESSPAFCPMFCPIRFCSVVFIQRTCRQLWRENPFHPSLNGFKYLILLYLSQCAFGIVGKSVKMNSRCRNNSRKATKRIDFELFLCPSEQKLKINFDSICLIKLKRGQFLYFVSAEFTFQK